MLHWDRAARKSLALEQQVSRTREVTLYPKYVLTQETVDYLKKPTFNIWNWEPNEMLCLLEHMYHELGLVTELKINPIILRRWLVCCLLYTSPSPRDATLSRMPSSA